MKAARGWIWSWISFVSGEAAIHTRLIWYYTSSLGNVCFWIVGRGREDLLTTIRFGRLSSLNG
jgi:hypothetical protein